MELLRNKNITVEKLIFWTFCAMFFSIPVGTTPAAVFGLFSLLLWIFSGRFFRDRYMWIKERKIFLPVIVFMAIPWIGLIYTPDPAAGWDFARKSYYWLYAFAIASLAFSGYSPKTFLKAFLCGLTITSIFSVLQFIDLIPITEWLPTVLRGALIITGPSLLVLGILVLSFYYFQEKRLKPKVLLLFLMLLFLFTLSISQRRAGYLAFIALSPIITYNLLGQKHIFKATAISILIVGALFLSPTVQYRLDQAVSEIRLYFEGNPRTSIGLRLHMWKGAGRIFMENPIIGIGTGGWWLSMEKLNDPAFQDIRFSHPHSDFFQIAANHGIVGLISLGWLFTIMLKIGWKHQQSAIGFSIFSYGLILLICGLFETLILEPATGILFTLFIGLCATLPENALGKSDHILPKETHS